MKQFNWEEFKDKNNQIAVHCKTEEEADDFCKQMHKHDMEWSSGNSYLNKTYWETYKSEIAYNNIGEYCESKWYRSKNYTILEWSDYMNNLTINLENVSDADKETIMGIIKKSKQPKRWRAERGISYYYITDCGNIAPSKEDGHPSDNFRFNTGNYFKTKEQAEGYVQKLLIQQKYKDMSDVTSKDCGKTFAGLNWQVRYNRQLKRVEYAWTNGFKYGIVCFSSEKKAQEAVKTIGDDNFKKYILEMAD